MSQPSLLVLHGITMSGQSMLRALGPLRAGLEAAGFGLVAPNGSHAMGPAEMQGLKQWLDSKYKRVGQNYGDSFAEGRFWHGGEHYDWLDSTTDEQTGQKTYRALEASLDRVAYAIEGKDAVGVLGFSQGSVLAVILAALASQGDARFENLQFGIFMAGFKPVFDAPKFVEYPIKRRFDGLFIIGDRDPLFTQGGNRLQEQAAVFENGEHEIVVVPGLGHTVPRDRQTVQRIVDFATSAAHRTNPKR